MRGRVCFIVGVLVFGLSIAGFVLTPTSSVRPAAVDGPAVVRRTTERRVALRAVPAPPDATVAAPVRDELVDPGPSPWQRYAGELAGSSFAVAHARGPSLPVSVSMGEPAIAALSNPTRVGAPRVALVVAEIGDWLQVLLPLRPNNSLGWVRRSDVDVTYTSMRVEIDRATRRLRVFDSGAVVMDEPVAIGRAVTPTPGGQFFTTELLQPPNPGGAYGPYAFTLSAYSTVYQRFGSGDGAVGLHGTNAPGSLGATVSHGCVRLSNDAISRLAMMLPLGTPVLIR
ncbi:MAG: L,D-transpeptidase [Acidimicrobiales bacterium]|nr:L,D-transpeptidase [Acidimicrobiales bacterium]